MPIINNGTVNPTSTVQAYGPDTRGPQGTDNSYVFKAVGSNSVVSLPPIESYPAMFAVTSTGASLQPTGFIVATDASNFVVVGATAQLNTTAGANVLDPTMANGVITFTANATFTTRDVIVTRIA